MRYSPGISKQNSIILCFTVSNVDETLGSIEVGRIVDEIGGNARGEIAKISRDGQNNITRVYLRNVSTGASFANGDKCLGSNGFTFTISDDVRTFPTGIFYIDFGTEAEEFGPFVAGQYYMAPENIQVQRNYLILWNQSDPSNQEGALGHPMRFSTTQDGPLIKLLELCITRVQDYLKHLLLIMKISIKYCL